MSICKESEHLNQSIYSKHSLHNTSCDGLWVWLQTASFAHCENQPFHLGTSVCVVCEVKAHCCLTQARRDAHHQFGFEILETFSCRPQDILSSFLLRLGFVFLSLEVICSCCLFPHSKHTVRWVREEHSCVFILVVPLSIYFFKRGPSVYLQRVVAMYVYFKPE